MAKRILYNFWGYLSDKIGISSPDGNATYTTWILNEFLNRGYEIYCGPIDRDKASVEKYGKNAFNAFSTEKRWKTYNKINFVDLNNLPEVDLFVNEWRMKNPYNQKKPTEEGYTPDLEIQKALISHYANNTKTVIFDLDHFFSKEEREQIKPWKVIETSLKPLDQSIGVFIPMDTTEMYEKPTTLPNKDVDLVYVGNDYRRRDDIERNIIPYSNTYPHKVHFYGNWTRDDKKEVRDKWPNITYHDRIGFTDFCKVISEGTAVPLLAPHDYKETGFMTARILETLMFGSIPIGFSDFYHINLFLPPELIVDVNDSKNSIEKILTVLKQQTLLERRNLRNMLIQRLNFMDVKNFVDTIIT